MGGLVVRIGIIEERVNVKGIPFTSHIGEWRRAISLDGRTPDKEIGILVAQIIQIETVIHQFPFFQRMMVGHIPSSPETFVISLLTIALIRKDIHSGRDIEVPDSPRMRKIHSFVQRIPDAGKDAFAQEGFYLIFSLFPK